MAIRIHPTADVPDGVQVGEGTSIWNHAQIRPGVSIGQSCIIAKGVYIDNDVVVGDNVKIQNNASLYHGVTVENGVFIGPHVCFTNDMYPRAVNPDGSLKSVEDWVVSPTLIRRGASLGANSTIVCGVTVGQWAMVGSGSVVTRDIPDMGLVWGNPARLRGFVCPCGERLLPTDPETSEQADAVDMACSACQTRVTISRDQYDLLPKS